MDVFQIIVTTAAIVLVLVMVYFVCQLFGPRANAWVRSSREEKTGLSQKKLYNANGFLIRSGSDFLLSSTGSFKRFDSVDRDCKQDAATGVSPLWSNLPAAQIPGQPLRPAPSPPPTSSSSAGSASTSKPHFFASHSLEQQQQPHHPHPIKQQSWTGRSSNSPSPTVVSTTTVAVPRPKRQFSTPGSSSAESANKLLPSFSFSPTRIKLQSRDSKEFESSPAVRSGTNPFLHHDDKQVAVLPVTSEETPNPPSLSDLASDSVVECQRVWWSSCVTEEDDSKAEQSVCGSNPFFVTPQKQLESENSAVSSEPSASKTTANVEPLNCETLIFNFDSVGSPTTDPSTKAVEAVATQSTGPATMESNGDLISLESTTTMGSANEGVSSNALLRQAEGSIRKLELAQAAEGEKESSTNTFLAFANTNKMNNPVPGSNQFYEPMSSSHQQKHSFNRMTKYSDSFLSAATGDTPERCDDDELILQCSRRYRSHSETEATIFERNFILSQHRRLSMLSNNPFLGPELSLQNTNNSHHQNYYPQQQSGYKNSPFTGSPTRNLLHKSNNPHHYVKQEQERWCSSNIINHNNNSALTSNPYNPVISKTLSETYLGQFMASSAAPTSSLPRSSSILMLLEQHHQQHHGPPLSPTVPQWAFIEGNERRDGCGSNGKSSAKSQWTNSEKVNVYASGGASFKRTLSSESVSSESSVLLADLESSSGSKSTSTAANAPPVTGYLCVGLQYDKSNMNEEGAELIVTVLEAKELLGPADEDTMDTFVRIYLVPDEGRAMQTKLFKNSSCPSYNETFSFWVARKHSRHSLWFHLYHSGVHQHTLIGEGELQIGDVKRPLTTWIALSDSRHANNTVNNFGELMFSLSYLPTAERLTVVVVKGRNLQSANGNDGDDEEKEAVGKEKPIGGELSSMSLSDIVVEPRKRHSCTSIDSLVLANVLVKVYLLKDGKKVSKKKTTMKRMESSPIYNESMIFSVPPYMLGSIQIRLTVAQITPVAESTTRMQFIPIGHVIVGNETTGKGLKHWNQMMTSLRKPVAMWHQLRRCSQTVAVVATGGPEQNDCTTKNKGEIEGGNGNGNGKGGGGEGEIAVPLRSS